MAKWRKKRLTTDDGTTILQESFLKNTRRAILNVDLGFCLGTAQTDK